VVTGVPAILLGYQAIKKITADPGRFAGLWRAKAGIIFGWIDCGVFGLWLGWRTGHESTLAGIAAGVGGLALAAGVTTLATKKEWGILRAIAFASAPVLFLVGSIAGVIGARADAATKIDLCNRGETNASTQLAAKNFAAAHAALKSAHDNCADGESAKLADLDRDLAQQEQVARKADADRAAAERAVAAAAKEKNAVETFPQASTNITSAYRRALNDTFAGKWKDANDDLSSAEAGLSTFEGTSVEQSKQYQALSAQLSALRKKVDAQLAAKAQAQADMEAKAEKPEPCVKLAKLFGAGSDLTDLQKDERWKQYAGKDFSWDLKVIEVSTGPLGGVHVQAECPNWPDLFPIQVEYDDATWASQLTKGQVWRLKGKLRGITLGTLIADGSTR
jgi:hypothetical protein